MGRIDKNKYMRIEQMRDNDKSIRLTITPTDNRSIREVTSSTQNQNNISTKPKDLLNVNIFLQSVLQTLLLPIGYPESVCPEYIIFQIWDTSQEACGYFRGILNNQAWLTNLGVGNPDRTIVSSVILTMILDYANMVSGLVIAGSPSTIRMFVSNQKFWVMMKEYMNFASIIFTLLSLSFPHHMLFILIIGKVIDAGASVIDGACHSTLVTHIARNNNFSDCNAKEKNQSRTLKLLLIALGYPFLIFVNENVERVFWAFITLSLLKITCQYKAMGTLRLRTLSPKRLQDCIAAWCKGEHEKMTIPYIAKNEPVLYPQSSDISSIGSSLDSIKCSIDHFHLYTQMHHDVKHIFITDAKCIQILLKDGATEEDILIAYIHFFVFRHYSLQQKQQSGKYGSELELVVKSLDVTMIEFSNIIRFLEKIGWDIKNMSLLPATDDRIKIQYLEEFDDGVDQEQKENEN